MCRTLWNPVTCSSVTPSVTSFVDGKVPEPPSFSHQECETDDAPEVTTSEHDLMRTNIDLAMFLDLCEHTFKKAFYRGTEAYGTKYADAVSGKLDVTDNTKSDNARGSSASSSWQAPVARGAPTATSAGSVLRRKFTLPPVRGLEVHLLSGQMPSYQDLLGHRV